MAVSSDSRVSGGRWRWGGGGGERAPTDEARLSQEDWQEAWGRCSMLEPLARVCLRTRTTVGVKAPERTEEQGETARLNQLLSLSQPSENSDSREDARLENRLETSVGLWTLKSAGGLFVKSPETCSAPGQIPRQRCWEGLWCLPTTVSIGAAGWRWVLPRCGLSGGEG